MKKNIEWLNNEVEKIIEKIKTGKGAFLGVRFFDEGYIHGMRDVQSIANQLDEPETLSQDWINKHKREHDEYPSGAPVLLVDDVKGLLVPKSKEITDDQEVLSQEWIDEHE